MVRRSKRHNKLGGGIWDTITNGTQSAWNTTKEAVKKTSSELTGTPAPAPITTTMSMGGRRRRRPVLKGGNCHANTSHTNIASTAAPYSVTTASPQVMVGGKTRKRRRSLYQKSNKGRSCRHKHRHTKRCKK